MHWTAARLSSGATAVVKARKAGLAARAGMALHMAEL